MTTEVKDMNDLEHSLPTPEEIKAHHHYADFRKESICARRPFLWVIPTLLLLVVATALMATLIPARKQHKSVSNDGTSSSSRLPAVIDFLNDLIDRELFEQPNSPQWKAAKWIADEDELQVPIPAQYHIDAYHFIQRYALAAFYHAMDGPNWRYRLDFVTSKHECTWHQYFVFKGRGVDVGVKCDAQDRVTKFLNFGNELQGQLPPDLGLLINLVELDLFLNQIQGTLPDEIQKLKKLDFLALQRNQLEGTIPEWFGAMSSLTVLSMGNNQFSGSLPPTFGLMKLEELYLNENMLTGDISPLTKIDTLQVLYAEYNQFSGRLDEIFNKSQQNLTELDLSNNNFMGTIPSDLFNIRVLDLHNNTIAGTFPNISSNGTFAVEVLALHNNRISGSIPTDLSNLDRLTHLDLSGNQLSGSIPTLEGMEQLTYLFLANNDFESGPIPETWSSLTNLEELSIKATHRTDTIPEFIGDSLQELVLLDVGKNNLTGNIPSNLANLQNCSFLILNDNRLTGSIPTSFSRLSNLVLVLMEQNELTGITNPICDSSANLETYVSDCNDEITCDCCTRCCNDNDHDCNEDNSWLANFNPNSDSSVPGKHFVFGDDMILNAAERR